MSVHDSKSSLLLLGVNHTTAPIEVRERLAIPSARLADATRMLAGQPGVREALILSTCNRVELLTVQEEGASQIGPGMLTFLDSYLDVRVTDIQPHVYEFRESEAIRHLFRVASSLDSMVVGEPQILGQVKNSWAVAREVGAVKSTLDPLLQRAFSVAKKVRTETQIGSSTVSIASVAAELARKIFGTLAGKTVLLIGAGKMSDLTARHLIQQGANTLLVSNRTEAKAEKIADALRTPAITTGIIPFDQLYEQAHRADIVITSTGAGQIITPERARTLLQRRKNRPVFFIDIAVPRDVDPKVNEVDGCFVYDIDDLQQVAASNQASRTREAEAAESIVSREVQLYSARLSQAPATEAIKQLLAETEILRQTELAKAMQRMGAHPLTAEQVAAMEALTRSLAAKLVHPRIAALKSADTDSQSD
ncbi:MAG: glutamyl-tRNA reductase [Acidobacteriota bacterium]